MDLYTVDFFYAFFFSSNFFRFFFFQMAQNEHFLKKKSKGINNLIRLNYPLIFFFWKKKYRFLEIFHIFRWKSLFFMWFWKIFIISHKKLYRIVSFRNDYIGWHVALPTMEDSRILDGMFLFVWSNVLIELYGKCTNRGIQYVGDYIRMDTLLPPYQVYGALKDPCYNL